MKRLPLLTLTLAALAGIIHVIPAASNALELDRSAIAHGQLWRLWTGHLTHFGQDHLRWDLVAFVALGTLLESLFTSDVGRARRQLAILLAASAGAISLSIVFFQPQFAVYRGLSGVDSALFGWVLMHLMRRAYKERQVLTLLIGGLSMTAFAWKCSFELVTGSAVFVHEPSTLFQPVPLAHLVGVVAGLVAPLSLAQGIVRLRE